MDLSICRKSRNEGSEVDSGESDTSKYRLSLIPKFTLDFFS